MIDLHSNLIGDEAVSVIADILRNDVTLEELLLNDNLISEEGVLLIIYALKENGTLCEVTFANTYSNELKTNAKGLSRN